MPSADSLQSLAVERAWVEINLDALAHNIRTLQGFLKPGTHLLAVVKADAYGHGAVRVATLAQQLGVTLFGVATVPEGIELRRGGITQRIVVMGAVQSPSQIAAIAHWQLEPTLCTVEQAQCFAAALTAPLPVHLKLDTGMSRLGQPWEQGADFVQQVQALPHLHIASLYSHLATADEPDTEFVDVQQARFETVIKGLRAAGLSLPPLHLANSAGTLRGKALHYDWVRVGLALYGLYPSFYFESVLALRPVLQLRARIVQIKTLPAGVGISYGHRFVTSRPSRVAVVGIGYADGVPRSLSNQMTVLVRGKRVPQVGVITMDQLVIDVTDHPTVAVGDRVTLLGRDGEAHVAAEDWATPLGTLSYEIVCGLQQRLPRLEIGDAAPTPPSAIGLVQQPSANA